MTAAANSSETKIPCVCGCGELISRINTKGRLARFKNGHNARGKNHYKWKGGRRLDKDGYVLIWKPEHPNSDSDGYVREHRLIMEQHLSRYLELREDVHHLNQIRADNRIENLQLMTHGEHSSLTHRKRLIYG